MRTVQSAILHAALRTSFDKKNAKISLLPPFPSSKMSYLQKGTKKLCTRPRLGQLENGLFDILWATLVGV